MQNGGESVILKLLSRAVVFVGRQERKPAVKTAIRRIVKFGVGILVICVIGSYVDAEV